MNRLYYGCMGVFISNNALLSNTFVNGVQSVGLDHNFDYNLNPSVGKSQVSTQGLRPSNQITIERIWANLENVIIPTNQYPTTYAEGYLLSGNNLGYSARGNSATDLLQFDIMLVYSNDSQSYITGTALDIMNYKKSLLTGINYQFDVSSSFKETLAFSNQMVNDESSNVIPTASLPYFMGGTKSSNYEILNRKNFDNSSSIIPTEISNITSFSGTKDGQNIIGITKIEVDVGINYTVPPDNGKWRGSDNTAELNYWTTISLPISVTTKFTINAGRSLQQSIVNSDKNFTNQRIVLVIRTINTADRTPLYKIVDLGNKNRLKSLSVTGGNTDGSIVEYTFTYENYNNDFSVYFRPDTNFNVAQQTTEEY